MGKSLDPDAISNEIRLLTEDATFVRPGPDALAQSLPKAADYLRRGKIAETLRECGAVLRRDSNHALAALYAGIAAYKRGDLDNARRYFRVFLDSHPDIPSVVHRVHALLDLFTAQLGGVGASLPRGKVFSGNVGSIHRVAIGDRPPGSVLNVNWVITPHCNFTCSYCTVYDNSASYPTLAQLIAAADKIAKLNRPDVKVVLTGGEPSLHPGYTDFVAHLARTLSNLSSLRTETNLSRTPRFYRDLMTRMAEHAAVLHFHASFHFEFTEIGKFLDNARFLAASGASVQIRVLAHPEHMAAVRRLAHELAPHRNERLQFIVKTIRKHFGNEADDRYTGEDLAWLSQVYDEEAIERPIVVEFLREGPGQAQVERQKFAANELIAQRLNRFKGMRCFAGVEMLSIDARGWLDRAVCFRGRPGTRPNIYRDPDIPGAMLEPVICPFDYCGCPEDIAITKVAASK